jgi:hypothetical protein
MQSLCAGKFAKLASDASDSDRCRKTAMSEENRKELTLLLHLLEITA